VEDEGWGAVGREKGACRKCGEIKIRGGGEKIRAGGEVMEWNRWEGEERGRGIKEGKGKADMK